MRKGPIAWTGPPLWPLGGPLDLDRGREAEHVPSALTDDKRVVEPIAGHADGHNHPKVLGANDDVTGLDGVIQVVGGDVDQHVIPLGFPARRVPLGVVTSNHTGRSERKHLLTLGGGRESVVDHSGLVNVFTFTSAGKGEAPGFPGGPVS